MPALVAGLALLLVPGAVALVLARAPRLVVVGAAGPVTVSVVTVAGVVAGGAGIPWTPVTFVGSVVLSWVVAAGVGRVRGHGAAAEGTAVDGRLLALALGAAAVLAAWPAMAAMGAPTSLPQQPDTIFHVGTIQSMVAAQDVSTLHAVGFDHPTSTGFYPAAFHAVAATLIEFTGVPVDVAVTVVALVTGSVLWPAGMVLLGATALGQRTATVVAAPVVAVAFTAFPTWLMGYGVLWPNLLGQAILPATLAVGLLALRAPRRASCWILLGVLGVGLSVAHPNAAFGLVVLGSVALGWHLLVRTAAPGPTRFRLLNGAAAVGFVLAVGVAWVGATRLADAMRASNPGGPEMPWRDAVVDVLFFAPRSLPELWVVGLLVLLGLAVTVRRAKTAWVALAWLVVSGLYLALTAVDSPATRLFTWPWFNNSPRLASLLVVPAALLATAALAALAGVGRSARRPSPAVRALAVTAGFVVVTLGADANARAAVLDLYYPPDDLAHWASRSSLRALDSLGEDLPADAVVAANPWRGGAYLALVADVRMLFPTEKTLGSDPVQKLLGAHLEDAATDPVVCAAVRDRGVGWALTGGELSSASRAARTLYRGVDDLAGAPGWDEVRSAGPYTLYRFTGCDGAPAQD